MELSYYLYIALTIFLLGFISTSFIKNKSISGIISIILSLNASVCLLILSFNIILKDIKLEHKIFSLSPLINSSFAIFIDSLSALFILIIAIVSFCVILFSFRYLGIYRNQSSQKFYPFIFLLFIASIGVVIAKDLLFFILFWELMTLSSWFLVLFEGEKRESIKAGLQYFIMTHVATAFLILASVILYSYGGDFNFSEIKRNLLSIFENNLFLAHFIIFCILLAFVTKAGILPFGFWLPNAYPQPPSSASSFFGGVMSKLAVYALLRFFLSLVPLSSSTQVWGLIIATAGVFSIFIGTIAALTQDEAKRLMSFHAIGQVGYMLLGIGIGLYFININPFLGVVALTGGLLHVFNNSIYKSLLFLNAGVIFYKTETTDLNKVAGLMKVMPLTAMTAIVGSLSIAGVPPFNGFVSKLLIFESSIWSSKVENTFFLIKGAFIVFGIISVFISAITLASFLKFVNSSFMGKLQGVTDIKRNIPWSMSFSQIILASICLITGIFPILSLELIYRAISSASQISLPTFSDVFMSNIAGFSVNFCSDCTQAGTWFPVFVIFSLMLVALVIFSFEKYAQATKREVDTWYGGKEHSPEEVTYTGHSFYQPFKEMVSFRIGNIKFKGLYPSEIPPLKVSLPKWIIKIFQPDEWLYYPIARKVEQFFITVESTYQKMIGKYITWFVLGSILIMLLVFYLAGDK